MKLALLYVTCFLLASWGRLTAQLTSVPLWRSNQSLMYPSSPSFPVDTLLDWNNSDVGHFYDPPLHTSIIGVHGYIIQSIASDGVLAVRDSSGIDLAGFDTGLSSVYFLRPVSRWGSFVGGAPEEHVYGFICGGVTNAGVSRIVSVHCGSFDSVYTDWWSSMTVPDAAPGKRWVLGDVVEGDLFVIEGVENKIVLYEDTDGDFWPDMLSGVTPMTVGREVILCGVKGFDFYESGVVRMRGGGITFPPEDRQVCLHQVSGQLQFYTTDVDNPFDWIPHFLGHYPAVGMKDVKVRYKAGSSIVIEDLTSGREIGSGVMSESGAFVHVTLSRAIESNDQLRIRAKDGGIFVDSSLYTPGPPNLQVFSGEESRVDEDSPYLVRGWFGKGPGLVVEGSIDGGAFSTLSFHQASEGGVFVTTPDNIGPNAVGWTLRFSAEPGSDLHSILADPDRVVYRSLIVFPGS